MEVLLTPKRNRGTFRLALAWHADKFTAVQSEFFDSAGVKIHYAVRGEGDPVILIHGLYSSARVNWDSPGVSARLEKHFRVIALDCRGHGESDKPTDANAYGINMVEDVVRLMDHLEIQRACVAGYSMGGSIALKLAATYPERLNRLVLCGMGWRNASGPLYRFWETAEGKRFKRSDVPLACENSFPELSVTEAEIKAMTISVEMIVGDRDPYREWYVEPLHQVRPDWPIHIIANANHINCPIKPDFKVQLEAALLKP
jgi:pimeloyl-ACP methyl ester carboxylesterase